MTIVLQPAALQRVQHFIRHTPHALGVRFGVKRTGCSGWAHFIEIITESHANDALFVQGEVRIYVDAQSLPLVAGTSIDYCQQGLGEAFVFDNPHATAHCGCGESFTTDKAFAKAEETQPPTEP